ASTPISSASANTTQVSAVPENTRAAMIDQTAARPITPCPAFRASVGTSTALRPASNRMPTDTANATQWATPMLQVIVATARNPAAMTNRVSRTNRELSFMMLHLPGTDHPVPYRFVDG